MDTEAAGYLGAAMLALFFARPVWISWCDFRKRYAEMRERAEEYHARGNVEDDSHDAEPEGRAWGMVG